MLHVDGRKDTHAKSHSWANKPCFLFQTLPLAIKEHTPSIQKKVSLDFQIAKLTAFMLSPFCVFHKVLLLPTYPLSLGRN
jgi:hypothetical protein